MKSKELENIENILVYRGHVPKYVAVLFLVLSIYNVCKVHNIFFDNLKKYSVRHSKVTTNPYIY